MYTMLGGFDYKCEVFSPKAKLHLKKKISEINTVLGSS